MRTDNPPPRTANTETEVLRGFLDYLRESVARKAEGAPEPAAREPAVPSGTSLLGLVTHLTAVESSVFLGAKVASWPKTFRPGTDAAADIVARYRDTVARANEVLDAHPDLAVPLRDKGPSLRWALTHMIEETGRHAGHADIIREIIDGETGR